MLPYKKYEVSYTEFSFDTLYLQAKSIENAMDMAKQYNTNIIEITKVSQGSDEICSLTPQKLADIIKERDLGNTSLVTDTGVTLKRRVCDVI